MIFWFVLWGTKGVYPPKIDGPFDTEESAVDFLFKLQDLYGEEIFTDIHLSSSSEKQVVGAEWSLANLSEKETIEFRDIIRSW